MTVRNLSAPRRGSRWGLAWGIAAAAVGLSACGSPPIEEAASCEQVVQGTSRAIVDAAEAEVALVLEAEGLDPTGRLFEEDDSIEADDIDIDALPTAAAPARPPVPDDVDPWDLIVHLGPPEDEAQLQQRADELRRAGTEMDCGPPGWANEPVAAVLREVHDERSSQIQDRGHGTTEDLLMGYWLAGAHHRLVGTHIIEPDR